MITMSFKRIQPVFLQHLFRGLGFVILGCVLGLAVPASVYSAASPSNIISYQGRLLNANRVPVSDTSASVVFSLYTASSGGTCVWSNSSASCASATARTVTLTDGLFSENLGDTGASYAAIGDSIFGDNASLYLQIVVNGETLTPRKRIIAAPYALNAQMLDGLDSDADGATSAALLAYNSSGNAVITGNPGGSGVSQGSLYVNPATGDTSADDVLFGVAVSGTSKFAVDAEGDVTVAGGLNCTDCIDWSDLSDSATLDAATTIALGSSAFTINLDGTGDFVIQDNGSVTATFLDSGVFALGGNATSAGSIKILEDTDDGASGVVITTGALGADYTLTLPVDDGASGEVLSTNGSGVLSWIAAGGADTHLGNTNLTLSGARTLTMGGNSLTFDGAGDIVFSDAGGVTLAGDLTVTGDDLFMGTNTSGFILVADGTNYNPVAVSGDVTISALGAVTIGANSVALGTDTTGNYLATLADAGAGDLTIANSGTETAGVTIDITDDALDFTEIGDSLTLDASTAITLGANTLTFTAGGAGNVVANLSSTGDFIVQDNGTAAFTVSDSGNIAIVTTTDAASAFTIANAGSLDTLFRVDSTARAAGGNVVKIGNSTGTDADTTLFVVDSATAVPTTNISAANGGLFYNSTSHKMYIIENGTAKILCNTTDAGCGAGGSTTLQNAYDNDADGSNAILALTTADDSVIIRNPSSSGTDLAYIMLIDQLAVAAKDALQVNNAGTGDILELQDNGTAVFNVADGGWFSSTNNSAFFDSYINLAGTADFTIKDGGTEFLTLSDTGGVSITLDATDNPEFRVTNNGTSSVVFDLASTGNFFINDNGTSYFRINPEDHTVTINDDFVVSGAAHTGVETQSVYTGTWDGSLGTIDVIGNSVSMGYQSEGAVGTTPDVYGSRVSVSANTNADADELYGVYGGSTMTSAGAIDTALYGVYGYAENGSAGGAPSIFGTYGRAYTGVSATTTNASGIYGTLQAEGSDITNGYGVYGTIEVGSANIVSAYAGYFTNANDGTTRYGVYGQASGGTTNYGGYFQTAGATTSYAMYLVQDEVTAATTTPTAQALVIDVNEAANGDEVILVRSDADGTPDTEFRFENDGDAFADGAWTGAGADYAEYFRTTDMSLDDYMVVCWDDAGQKRVEKCAAGDTRVVGVMSTNPGFIGNSYTGADGDLEENRQYALVGLVGQIETWVTTEDGSITAGDALTASMTRAGYAGKAQGGTYIIGRALESFSGSTGRIKVLVQPMWYGGEVLADNGEILIGALHDASVQQDAVDSAGLRFTGSVYADGMAQDVELSLRHTFSDAGDARLALANNAGADVMTFGSTGDLAIAGKFYPSDRGALQYGAYVYYDSTGVGYMRTNAAGWATGSYDFAEMFPSSDALLPGEVVELSSSAIRVQRSLGETYSNRIAGVVSTRPGFLAGAQEAGSYPVALAGRVPTKVSGENGAIAPGDPLTTASLPGYAMKATTSGAILGYALESFSGSQGEILVFIRPTYWASASRDADANSSVIGLQSIESLNVTGVLNMNGGAIVSVGTLSGIGMWEIQEDGDIVTQGRLTQVVRSLQNTQVETYAVTAPEVTVQLSGTAQLHSGMARIDFGDVSDTFSSIIAPDRAYRVFVTPAGLTGQLFVTDRTNAGFMIQDAAATSGVAVDWLVIAYRHDYAPEDVLGDPEASPEADEIIELESDPQIDPEPPASEDPFSEQGSIDVLPENTPIEIHDVQEPDPLVEEGAVIVEDVPPPQSEEPVVTPEPTPIEEIPASAP